VDGLLRSPTVPPLRIALDRTRSDLALGFSAHETYDNDDANDQQRQEHQDDQECWEASHRYRLRLGSYVREHVSIHPELGDLRRGNCCHTYLRRRRKMTPRPTKTSPPMTTNRMPPALVPPLPAPDPTASKLVSAMAPRVVAKWSLAIALGGGATVFRGSLLPERQPRMSQMLRHYPVATRPKRETSAA
jgi:hypothetical protein